ncbi:MAG: ATP-binding protein [Spirulina sp.]
MKVRERGETIVLSQENFTKTDATDSQNDLTHNRLGKLTVLFQKILHPRWTISRKLGVSYILALSVAAIGTIGGIVWGDYYEKRALEALNIANTQKFLLEDLDKNLSILQTQPQKILRALGKPLLTEYEQSSFSLQIKHIQKNLLELSTFITTHNDRAALESDRYQEILQTYQTATEDYERSIHSLWQKMDSGKLADEEIPQAQQDILAFMQGDENRQLEIRLDRLSETLSLTIKGAEEQTEKATWELERAQSLRLLIIIASIIISGVCGAILAHAIGRAITLPLIRVGNIAHKVTREENFQLRAPAISDDEIGSLANSLNQLIAWVGEYVQRQQEQIQLIQDEKMAGLSKMVGGVAHEINNPVGFIHGNLHHIQNYMQDLMGLVQIYQREYPELTPEIKTYLEEIDLNFLIEDSRKMLKSMEVGTNRIRSIVTSLRNFSRLDESGKKIIDIHEGIESTLLVLSSRIHHDFEVCRDYEKLPGIECYPAQLNQVFLNVLTNSLDSLEDIKKQKLEFIPQIKIATEKLNNSRIQVKIKDNGTGIHREIQQNIFDPFFTTKPIGKGTGLGLSICYKIIEKHQGKIEVISEIDRGTEIIISLPIALSS